MASLYFSKRLVQVLSNVDEQGIPDTFLGTNFLTYCNPFILCHLFNPGKGIVHWWMPSTILFLQPRHTDLKDEKTTKRCLPRKVTITSHFFREKTPINKQHYPSEESLITNPTSHEKRTIESYGTCRSCRDGASPYEPLFCRALGRHFVGPVLKHDPSHLWWTNKIS